jgi:hypothetical protein
MNYRHSFVYMNYLDDSGTYLYIYEENGYFRVLFLLMRVDLLHTLVRTHPLSTVGSCIEPLDSFDY